MLGLTTGGESLGPVLAPCLHEAWMGADRQGALLSILRPGLPLRGALSAPLGIEFPPRKLWA